MAAVVWRPLTISVRVHHSDGHTNGYSNVLYLESPVLSLSQAHVVSFIRVSPLSHIPKCDIAGARMGKFILGQNVWSVS